VCVTLKVKGNVELRLSNNGVIKKRWNSDVSVREAVGLTLINNVGIKKRWNSDVGVTLKEEGSGGA